MKRTLLSTLTVLVASAAIPPIASAAEPASLNIQSARLEALDARTKNTVHKLRLEHLNNQTKAIEDIQAGRLDALDARTKAIDNVQEALTEVIPIIQRESALDTRYAAVNVENLLLELQDVEVSNELLH